MTNEPQKTKTESQKPLTINPSPDASEFSVIKETAAMLIKTGFLPPSIKTPEQAVAIILTGREIGIGTMAALNTINVIQGKPTISPQLMLALIERSKQLDDVQIEPHNGNAVRCTMKRRGRSPHTEYFGDAEARAMQLAGKDNYKKQPQTMYRWRAVAACARVVFPDVILGLYTPDEMGAEVNEDGELLPPAKLNVVDLPKDENENNENPTAQESSQTSQDGVQTAKELDTVTNKLTPLQEQATTLLKLKFPNDTDGQKGFLNGRKIDQMPVNKLTVLIEDLKVL